MDVDAPTVGIFVEAFQPGDLDDAGDDGVSAFGINGYYFAGGAAGFEYHAFRLAISHFLGDGVDAERGAMATVGGADAEFG